MTGTQLALLGGLLVGLGVAMLVLRFAPSDPDAVDVARRMSPDRSRTRRDDTAAAPPADRSERMGVWAMRRLPAAAWGATPTRELALLRIPLSRHYGKKVSQGLVGLALPPLVTALFAVLGIQIPFVIPAIASLALGTFLFFAPDLDVKIEARNARAEFSHALGAFVELVALERAAGSGPRQSLEAAAEIGDSWVFQRLSEELQRSRWSGRSPWDALRALSEEFGLPELAELADIMRLSGEEGAQIYEQLRARSSSMRSARLSTELGRANAAGERLSVPMSLLGVIFMCILVAPAMLRVMG